MNKKYITYTNKNGKTKIKQIKIIMNKKKYITYAEAERIFKNACNLGKANFKIKDKNTSKKVYVLSWKIRTITENCVFNYCTFSSYEKMVAYWVTVIANKSNQGGTQYKLKKKLNIKKILDEIVSFLRIDLIKIQNK